MECGESISELWWYRDLEMEVGPMPREALGIRLRDGLLDEDVRVRSPLMLKGMGFLPADTVPSLREFLAERTPEREKPADTETGESKALELDQKEEPSSTRHQPEETSPQSRGSLDAQGPHPQLDPTNDEPESETVSGHVSQRDIVIKAFSWVVLFAVLLSVSVFGKALNHLFFLLLFGGLGWAMIQAFREKMGK
jgi:hypothetical protein